ncbi:MAG: ATP-binding protein, partial [Bacteroidales bacterium]|nr:ATP-binding protein [Bacteroidales bacterium]
MNSREFRDKIYIKRPRYQGAKREVLNLLAKKGGKKGEFLLFGPFYEIYMYAFFIGYNRKERLPLLDTTKKESFRDFGLWKPQGIIDYILLLLFSDKEIIKYDWDELEELKEEKIDEVISNIVRAIEEYANAGLSYLNNKIKTDKNEFTDPFVFINILNEVIDKNKEKDKFSKANSVSKKLISETKEQLRIKSLIENGESSSVEFKSSLRYCLHQQKPDKKVEHSSMKTIAAFINSDGGTLLIGIEDNKNVIGLENDFNTFKKSSDKIDEFQKHLDNLIENYMSNSAFPFLKFKFHEMSEGTVCEIRVKPNTKKHIILKNMSDGKKEEFFIRRSASSIVLTPTEML